MHKETNGKVDWQGPSRNKRRSYHQILFCGACRSIDVASLTLKIMGKKHTALFVGQWAHHFILLGVYNKIVKVAGHDGEDLEK